MFPSVRARGRIPAINEAVGVQTGAKVRGIGRLTGTIARLQRVAGIDEAVAVVNIFPCARVTAPTNFDC